MEKFKLKRALGENGLSLVEVLASFVILTLLLTTFLMMFIQSAKVNKASEHVIDATYLAQTEMETIYSISVSGKYSERENKVIVSGYVKINTSDNWLTFEKVISNKTLIKIRLQNKTGTMDRVIVEVFEMPKKTLKAKMENILVWGTE